MKWPWVSRATFEALKAEHFSLAKFFSAVQEERDGLKDWCSRFHVGRESFDMLKLQNEQLSAQNAALIEQLTAVGRAQVGLPEKPREPKKAEPMPADIRAYIDRWGESSSTIREETERRLWGVYRRTRDWDQVRKFCQEPAEIE